MKRIRIAIQKSGRLSEKSVELLEECGFSLSINKSKLTALPRNFPAEILFLRDDDIPGYVEDGVAELGIVGLNVVEEKNPELKILSKLGFGKCKLALAASQAKNYSSSKDLAGMKIATSYPNILKKYFTKKEIDCDIQEISGSVEIAPAIGLADAICDLVSSGGTLLANRLKEIETILESEAVLISAPSSKISSEEQAIIDELVFRISTVNNSKNCKYIVLNSPNESLDKIFELLPAINSPTILPLAEDGWSAVHAVVSEDVFWDLLGQLKEAGAEGITVLPIEKIIV